MAIGVVEQCVSLIKDAWAAATSGAGKRRKRLFVAPLRKRKVVWEASKGKFPDSKGVALRALCIHPVSYTHLTLPTNREV